MPPTSTSPVMNLALLLARLALGYLFAVGGFAKLFDSGMTQWMSMFRGIKPGWLPNWFATPFGYALPFVELIFGVLLMLGLFGRFSAWLLTLVLLSIIIGATGIQEPQLWYQINSNAICLTLAILLAAAGPGRISIDGIWRRKR